MKHPFVPAATLLALCWLGCQTGQTRHSGMSAGSVALSRDDALVYVAEADNDALLVVDAATESLVASVPVGRQPERVVVGPDDTIYVANRLSRSVSVVRRGEWTEAARVEVGVEPVDLALSDDGRTLYVVNSTALGSSDVGTLMAIDTAALRLRWELAVGHEPRAVALLPNGRAAVTLYKQGALVLVDLNGPGVIRPANGDVYQLANATALRSATGTGDDPIDVKPGASLARPRAFADLVTSPDGQRLYATTLWAAEGVLGAGVVAGERTGGAAYGGGVCSAGAVASPGMVTFEADGTVRVDDLSMCGRPSFTDTPPTLLRSRAFATPLQGPTAVAIDASGAWLYVVNKESNNVAIVATTRESVLEPDPVDRFGGSPGGNVQHVVNVGAGPTGIALSNDGKRAYVYSQFDHALHVVTNSGTGLAVRFQTRTIQGLAPDVLSPQEAAGRRLFFSAVDSRMNDPQTGISCASCHLEGREDGHVWNFPEGPRQTPSLAGRLTAKTPPFHWNGEFPSLTDFMSHTVVRRMGGSGVSLEMQRQLEAFIAVIPPPDNPHRTSAPTEAQIRGRVAFEKAQCHGCHTGEAMTNNGFADVGTLVTSGPVPDRLESLPQGGLNTPSLLGLARTAPYLHDGSAETLLDRLVTGKDLDRHGRTSVLSEAEMKDLVEYLKSL